MGRILVVDDHADTVAVVGRLLSRRGHHVEVAPGGRPALERLRGASPPPDVLLLDWRMPDVGGEDVLAALRADPDLAGVRVLVYSASVEHEHRHAAQRLGADDYLVKGSAGWDELISRVESLMGGHPGGGGFVDLPFLE